MDLSSDYQTELIGTAQFADLIMINGDLVGTSDVDSRGTNPVLQSILQRLRTYLGEYFLDNTLGVPWFQQLLGYNGANSTTDAVIQNTILATPGVQMLTSYSSSFDGPKRLLTVSFTCNTTAGQVSYTGSVTPNADADQ